MELEEDMSSLQISDKGRRYTRLFNFGELVDETPSPNSNEEVPQINDKKRRYTRLLNFGELVDETLSPNSNEGSPSELPSTSESSGMSLRKKIRTAQPENRRVVMKPRKIIADSSLKDIEKYYLDKRVKGLNPSLETIFEEPRPSHAGLMFMSNRKFKRCINLSVNVKNNTKIKKRRMKARKIAPYKKGKGTISIELLKKTLEALED